MAFLLTALILIIKYRLTEVGRSIFATTIALLILTAILLAFSIYASCKRNRILRIILTIVCIAVGLGGLALSLYCLAGKGAILHALGSLWDEPISEKYIEYVAALENAFECCGWNDSRPSCSTQFTDLCNATFSRVFSRGFAAVSSALLVVSLALLSGCVFAVRAVLTPELPSDRDESLSGSLIGSARADGRSKHYNASAW
jgi:hypothetical protein